VLKIVANILLQHVNKSTFTKLPTLRVRLNSPANGPEKVPELRELFRLDTSQDELRNIMTRLLVYNDALCTSEETIASWWPQEKNRRPAYEVRENANTLYQTLSECWPQCGKGAHSAKLCLSLYEQSEGLDVEVDFDFLFSTHKPVWLQSKVTVVIQGYVARLSESDKAK
jgi:hypothetical protein